MRNPGRCQTTALAGVIGVEAQMHAICASRQSPRQPIVDHDARSRAACETDDVLDERGQVRRVEVALTNLNQVHASVDRVPHLVEEARSRGIRRRTAA